ncbi:MAG: hypothetical protein ACI4Q4_04520 [Oscillospiraceae bacterium]
MAKRGDGKKPNDALHRAVIRNWIICGISLAAILILYGFAK